MKQKLLIKKCLPVSEKVRYGTQRYHLRINNEFLCSRFNPVTFKSELYDEKKDTETNICPDCRKKLNTIKKRLI
jgi:hypothetical protein